MSVREFDKMLLLRLLIEITVVNRTVIITMAW